MTGAKRKKLRAKNNRGVARPVPPVIPVSRHVGRSGLRIGINIAVLCLSLSGLVGLTTSALFTDAATNSGNTFSTSSVDLVLGSSSAFLTMSSMMPGSTVTAPLTVSNPTGKAPFRYSVKSSTTENALAGQLKLSVKAGVTTCDNAGFAASGTSLYTNGALGTIAGSAILGDSSTGAQAGDRSLATNSSETLCFQVVLPTATTNTHAGLTTTATFTFDAEQTENN